MERSTREIEVKLPFDSAAAAQRLLERTGARLVRARRFEDNIVFDRKDGSLSAAKVLLRMRQTDQRWIVTLKLPVPGEHRHKVREELETQVEDGAMLTRILEHLGFARSYRYQKQRTLYTLDELTICLDETPIGCWVELEGPPDAIDHVAQRLGFMPERYVRETYLDLHAQHAHERGIERGDLLFE